MGVGVGGRMVREVLVPVLVLVLGTGAMVVTGQVPVLALAAEEAEARNLALAVAQLLATTGSRQASSPHSPSSPLLASSSASSSPTDAAR